jgi:ABC-type multidrug transport system fused ATPase/permease subunit
MYVALTGTKQRLHWLGRGQNRSAVVRFVFRLCREVLSILPTGARRFINVYAWTLASLAVFDAAALGLLALVIGPLSAGQTVTLPIIGELEVVGVIWVIVAICALMILKGALSVLVMWWASRRIAAYDVALGDRLFRAYLRSPWLERIKRNASDMSRYVDSGVDVTINTFVMQGATIAGEITSFVAVVGTLAIVQPLIALIALIYLSLLAAVLYFLVAGRARRAGEIWLEAALLTARLLLEAVAAIKEIALRRKEPELEDVVRASRTRSARAKANVFFLGQLPRFALEAGLIGGFVVVGGAGYLLGGIEQAVAAIALFALAGFRMAPSVVRLQSVVSQMLSVASYPERLIPDLRAIERVIVEDSDRASLPFPSSPESIHFESVSFRYSDGAPFAVRDVSLDIPFGASVAFVGRSGSGKSTMVDLILGLIEPNEGVISVNGVSLGDLREGWRSRVGYVPQNVTIFDASIACNVALTWTDDYDPARVRAALEQAQLWDFVSSREGDIHSRVGEGGIALSGGQRQRLGIARSLYSDPLVLVMDEATSALDTRTEAAVSESISSLAGDRTLVVVAHRLATIQHADRVFFMSDGEIIGAGTFDDLVKRFPDFAEQAQLAGLA